MKPDNDIAKSQLSSVLNSELLFHSEKNIDHNMTLTKRNNNQINGTTEVIRISSTEKETDPPFVPDIEGFYDRLINEAPYIPGDKMDLVPVSEIPWANPSLMKDGVKFGICNLFALVMANTAALMFGFSVKPESVVLLKSGKFHQPENAFLRYMSTGKRISTWYRCNICDVNSEGFKQIKAVRKLHTYYAKSSKPFPSLAEMGYTPDMKKLVNAIRKDLAHLKFPDAPEHLLTWNPPLQFSQFDFGFIGLVYLYPKSLGVTNMELMDGFFHFWAVIGRLLGLEDRFNLALHADPKLFKKLYENIGMASLKSTDKRVISLQYALMEGLGKRLPLLTMKGWVYYGLKDQGDDFEGTEVWKLMNAKDKICYYMIKGTMAGVRNNIIIRVFVNLLSLLLLQLSYWIYLPKGCPLT
ncbi:hypothetical protein Fcan01_13237 [Folsomia candida]|uniref:Uncharacterized protein n=1 Tax=Folsomia candida TaxID=158441 RepID=A0A226E4J1_FOLCA|nr:hypothetical protein Fcan01_13237 [Folsomia candida]